jgi:hypothetical protein
MKLWNAICLTVCLYLGSIMVSVEIHHNVAWYMTLITTLWAAIDSSKIQLKRYMSGVGPIAFFFLCMLLWLVGFPWYLWMRHQILTGKAELKTNDPRCVRCEELINPELAVCPKCGWRQPK